MSQADDVQDDIVENMQAPKRSKSDVFEMEQHSLGDQLKVLDRLKSNEGATKPGGGIRMQSITPVYR